MEIKEVNLILPWPPSVNQIWASSRRGNWYLTKVAKDFKDAVAYYVLTKKAQKLFNDEDVLSFEMIAYPPDNRRRDLDNLNKICLDSLQDAGVFPNDCQIKKITMEMMHCDGMDGRVIVSVKKIA